MCLRLNSWTKWVDVIKILTTKTSSGLDFKDALLNGQEGGIRRFSSEVEDENVALTSFLPRETETVDDNSCEGRMGKILAKLLEKGASERGLEVETLIKGVDPNDSMGSGGKGKFGMLASGTETTESVKVRRDSLRKGRL